MERKNLCEGPDLAVNWSETNRTFCKALYPEYDSSEGAQIWHVLTRDHAGLSAHGHLVVKLCGPTGTAQNN